MVDGQAEVRLLIDGKGGPSTAVSFRLVLGFPGQLALSLSHSRHLRFLALTLCMVVPAEGGAVEEEEEDANSIVEKEREKGVGRVLGQRRRRRTVCISIISSNALLLIYQVILLTRCPTLLPARNAVYSASRRSDCKGALTLTHAGFMP